MLLEVANTKLHDLLEDARIIARDVQCFFWRVETLVQYVEVRMPRMRGLQRCESR